MSIETPTLKKIAFSFIGTLIALAGLLYVFQRVIVARLPKEHQKPPSVSPNKEVEFESGEVRREWLKKEERK